MSLGESGSETGKDRTAELRALAHPLRLRMLSLLTGAAMTAAEIARELEVTHANASYHLRQLLAAGLIVVVGEERIRGGVATRYRHEPQPAQGLSRPRTGEPAGEPSRYLPADEVYLLCAAIAAELQRRAALRRPSPTLLTDAELWLEPGVWDALREQLAAASHQLHLAARPPRSPGTIRVNATLALFELEADR